MKITRKKIYQAKEVYDRLGLWNASRAIFWHFFKEPYLAYLICYKRAKLKEFFALRREKYPAEYCENCGICCRACPNLNKETKLCQVWSNADYRCKAFPFIPQQLEFWKDAHKCRYYFVKDLK